MTNYYIEKDNKILLFDEDKQKLQDTIAFMPQYKGLKILETERPIINFEFADTTEYIEKQLNEAKTNKYNEINNGARIYLESGEALFELSENQHIEATDGNIGKLSAYALSYITGTLMPSDAVYWNTKEDETIALNQEQLATVLQGLGQVQAEVWNVKFPYYLKQLENATTVEEVNAITVDYSLPIPEENKETNENTTDTNLSTDIQNEVDTTASESDEVNTNTIE